MPQPPAAPARQQRACSPCLGPRLGCPGARGWPRTGTTCPLQGWGRRPLRCLRGWLPLTLPLPRGGSRSCRRPRWWVGGRAGPPAPAWSTRGRRRACWRRWWGRGVPPCRPRCQTCPRTLLPGTGEGFGEEGLNVGRGGRDTQVLGLRSDRVHHSHLRGDALSSAGPTSSGPALTPGPSKLGMAAVREGARQGAPG